MSESVFEAFRRNLRERPDSAAFLIAAGDRSLPITWRQFARDIDRIAVVIRRFVPGATVGLLGENSYEWITAHAAAMFAGVTAVPLETTLSAAEIAERLAFTGARALVHSALYAEKAREAARLLSSLHTVGFGSDEAEIALRAAEDELAAGRARSIFELPPRRGDETATILFTSGTTSSPRGAELTPDGFAAFADFSSRRLEMAPGDRSLMLLPLHHVFGLCATYLMLMRGVALGVCPDFRRLFDAVVRFRARFLCLVPALAEIFAQKIVQRGTSAQAVLGSPLEWVLCGGAPLAARTDAMLTALGVRVQQIYGLTETSALYAMSPFEDRRPGTVGLACGGAAGMETRVSDSGELLIRGPAVMKGYFRDPERTANAFLDGGWFRTGDLGRIDADGFVTITGRISRTVILSSGKKVAPEELEAMLMAIPGVREAVVCGNGESRDLAAEIYAVVSEATVRRQVDSLNRRQPVHKRIRSVTVRTEPFPRTASGKIRLVAPSPDPHPHPLPPLPPPSPRISPPSPQISPPPSPPPPPVRDESTSLRRRVTVWSCASAVMAVVVLAVNVLPWLSRQLGLSPQEPLRSVFVWFEESGEIFLAFFAILTFVVSTRLLRPSAARRRDSGRRDG